MWMDGSDHNGDGVEDNVTANINVWNDKSGNARHADSKGGDPQFKAGVLNGMGVIDFDGNDEINEDDMADAIKEADAAQEEPEHQHNIFHEEEEEEEEQEQPEQQAETMPQDEELEVEDDDAMVNEEEEDPAQENE